jgi:formylglycine-generating enzyme required for sulfatase activity
MIATVLMAAMLAQAVPAGAPDATQKQYLMLLSEWANAKSELARLQAVVDAIKQGKFDAANDEGLKRLADQLTTAENDVTRLESRYGKDSDNPDLLAARAARDSAGKRVAAARDSIKEFYELELAGARSQEEGLLKDLDGAMPTMDQEKRKFEEDKRKFEEDKRKFEADKRKFQTAADEAAKQIEQENRAKQSGYEQRVDNLQKQMAGWQAQIRDMEIKLAHAGPVLPPQPGDLRINPRDTLNYTYIPAGSFQMGCVPQDKNCDKDEQPRHEVTLTTGFWITTSEVTVKAYRIFLEKEHHLPPKTQTQVNPEYLRTENPIVEVTWDDARAYCGWTGGRLLTEAEWEYAARGGKPDLIYPWGNEVTRNDANYLGTGKKGEKDRYQELAPAGTFKQNAWGLEDVAGNVSEWVADFSSANYDDAAAADPAGPREGKERIARGGSWAATPRELRTSRRKPLDPSKGYNGIGIRCVVENLGSSKP